ncbi:CBS-domain-containing protein [Rhizoclosmatium globosum]|uniref:CBS-domain-containing protein n=1 Tax=Rhizoclosmatium globosum TaxID=329046 RepID=A0A1Y2BN45_9FUNG|nr:hypothetical protein HDU99_001045 [Rhizoclosmatium hyalinum]KAJ3295554.1 hypothetical protein HDU79_008901 [Rhizoclosmatium sp. JEL0117]ORY36186.1 CBS-domain-containing protein [Rhizoclosmatium globosum]|eukprot:ORY36186.1 CBS-domain-containing protein [Rhizoclosmatium globosum]
MTLTATSKDGKRTVQSLGSLLSAPVIVLESAAVSQVCLVMAAKRVDAVLLVDGSGSLSGILTGGDVSRRVVAGGLDGQRTKCANVMTQSPLSVRSSAAVSLALRQMVARRCRHLPVLSDEEGCEDDLAGLLDITQCVFSRIKGLDQKDLSRMDAVSVGQAVANSMLPLVGASASIRDACIVMRDARHTGVLVVNESNPDVLVGILTNKDVMLRVLASGMDPEQMTVEQAMTPHPDFVSPATSVLEALRMLNDGHYLHLPVMQDGKPVGLVDLLSLTMSILDYMLKIDREQFPESHTDAPYAEGPLWNRFWNTSTTSLDDGNSSYKGDGNNNPLSNHNTPTRQTPNTAINPTPFDDDNNIEPLDNDDAQSITSAGAFYRKQRQKQQIIEAGIALAGNRQQSMTPSLLSTENLMPTSRSGFGDSFVFKLHDLNGTIHRFNAPATDLKLFLRAVEYKTGRTGVRVVYKNPSGVKLGLSSGQDLAMAVSEARACGMHRVVVYVVDSTGTGGGGGGGVPMSGGPTSPLLANHQPGMGMLRQSFDGLGLSSEVIEAGWVRLNVGGVRFETKSATLVAASVYFSTVLAPGVYMGGEVKVDRDGDLFRHVMHFLRMGVLSSSCEAKVGLLKDLIPEAEFYGCPELLKVLQEKIAEAEQVVVVTDRGEMLQKLGKGFKVLLVEEGSWIMKKE